MDALVHAALSNAAAAALLAAVLIPAARLLRRPALTHLLCVLVLLKLVTPPLFSLPLRWLPARAAEPAREAPASVLLPDEMFTPEVTAEAHALARLELTTPAGPESPQPTRHDPGVPWGVLLLAAWGVGSLLYVAAVMCGVASLGRAMRLATPAPPEVRRQVRVLARRLGLRRCPSAWFLPGGTCPLLVAVFWRPRLLIPVRFWERLDAVQREGVLLHELAHYRRRDHWVRVLELAVAVLYWWHPAAWWARREMREAEEQCCDAWVVWSMPQAVRQYMSTLLEAVDLSAESSESSGANRGGGLRPAAAVAMLSSGMSQAGHFHRLERRLTMIKRRDVNRRLSAGGLAAVCGLAVLLPLGPTLVRAESPEKTEQADRAEQADRVQQAEKSAREERKSDDLASDDGDRDAALEQAEAAKAREEAAEAREQAREQAEKARERAEKARDQAAKVREQAREQALKAAEQVRRAQADAARVRGEIDEQLARRAAEDADRRARADRDASDRDAARREADGRAERDARREAARSDAAKREAGDAAGALEEAELERAVRDVQRQLRQLEQQRARLQERKARRAVPPRPASPAEPARPATPARPADPAEPAKPPAAPRPPRAREQLMLRVEGDELQAVDGRSGRTIWTFDVGGEALAPVVLDGRRVSVKRADGKTFVLDLRTGQVQGDGTGSGGRR